MNKLYIILAILFLSITSSHADEQSPQDAIKCAGIQIDECQLVPILAQIKKMNATIKNISDITIETRKIVENRKPKTVKELVIESLINQRTSIIITLETPSLLAVEKSRQFRQDQIDLLLKVEDRISQLGGKFEPWPFPVKNGDKLK